MSTLSIERLNCRYRVAREHPNPWGVQSRLDALLRDGIGGRWWDALAPVVPEEEGGLLLIRRLDIKLVLGAGIPDDRRLAALWSRGIARALGRALAAEPDGQWLIRFPSRAAYLARLAEDIVAGRAARSWYYQPFRDLAGLPAGAALRAVLCRERALIAPVLALLAERDRLDWVTAPLSDADAHEILEAVLPAAADSALRTDAALRAAVAAGRPRRWWSARPPIVALHLLAAATLAGGESAPSPALIEAVQQAAAILAYLRTADPDASGSPADLARCLRRDAGAAPAFDALRVNHPAVAGAVLQSGVGVAVAAADAPARTATAFGGIFLLLPALADLKVERLLEEAGLPLPEIAWAAPLARWLLLLKCLGPAHRPAARVDPALRLVAGLRVMPSRMALRRLGRITGALIPALRSALAASIERQRLTSGDPPVRDAVRAPGGRWLRLDRDGGNGLWLRVEVLGARPADPPPAATTLPPARAEVAHFHTAAVTGALPIDLFWSQCAAILLNITARRLPGFASSSAAYLCRNFLVGVSLIEQDTAGVRVDLPRVPLQVVLRVAGSGGRHDVPWLPGGTLSIEPSEAYNDDV